MHPHKEKILSILQKYIFDKKVFDNMPENPSIIDDLKINSARIVDIVLDIEEAYQIEIDNKTLQKIKTLKDIIAVVENKPIA